MTMRKIWLIKPITLAVTMVKIVIIIEYAYMDKEFDIIKITILRIALILNVQTKMQDRVTFLEFT